MDAGEDERARNLTMSIPPIIIRSGDAVAKPAIPSPSTTPELRIGARGPLVVYIQQVLNSRAGQGLAVDGVFGLATQGAVMNLQRFFGRTPTGIIDPMTWNILGFLALAQPGSDSDDISDRVTKCEVSLSMDRVSQIAVTVSDPNLEMFQKNYFQIRRIVDFLGMRFEIASVEIRQSTGGEEVTFEARNEKCQLLKRDKGKKTFNTGSATAFAALMAREKGMSFFGEKSSSKGTISRVQNDSTDESSWDVLRRLAGENQFVLFETDNRLFFTTQQFLIGKYAVVGKGTNPGFLVTPIRWLSEQSSGVTTTVTPAVPFPAGEPLLYQGMPANSHVRYVQTVLKDRAGQNIVIDGIFGNQTLGAVQNLQRFFNAPVTGKVDFTTWAILKFLGAARTTTVANYSITALECPNVRKSDDDVYALTLSFQVTSEEGRQLRPGMTVTLADIPYFDAYFIINEVRWTEGDNSAVSVSARTPEEPDDRKKASQLRSRIDLTGGGFANIEASNAFELV
jgi:peptidoglycan hydrolase-like protein with peptidoglycan-binding domain